MSVTEADLLEQVQWALYNTADPEGAMSVIELAEALEMAPQAVRTRLKQLIKNGNVEVVKVPRTNIVGIVAKQYCYRIVKGKTIEDE